MSKHDPVANDEPAPQPEALAAEPIVYLSLEGEVMQISELAAKQSGLLEGKLANHVSGSTIPLEKIDKEALKKIVTWCERHKGEAIPVMDESYPRKVDVPEWDVEFLDIDNNALFHLIMAANYLDIKQLMSYACKKVADMATGKTPEEIAVIYGLSTNEEYEAFDKAPQAEEANENVNP